MSEAETTSQFPAFIKQERGSLEDSYEELVERLILNNRLDYSELPYQLRISRLNLFYVSVRVARDTLQDASLFVKILEQFLTDIDQLEKEQGVSIRLRRRAVDTVFGVEHLFSGVTVFEEFIHQQKMYRSWLVPNE